MACRAIMATEDWLPEGGAVGVPGAVGEVMEGVAKKEGPVSAGGAGPANWRSRCGRALYPGIQTVLAYIGMRQPSRPGTGRLTEPCFAQAMSDLLEPAQLVVSEPGLAAGGFVERGFQ